MEEGGGEVVVEGRGKGGGGGGLGGWLVAKEEGEEGEGAEGGDEEDEETARCEGGGGRWHLGVNSALKVANDMSVVVYSFDANCGLK